MNPQRYEEAPACYHGYLDILTSDDALSELRRSAAITEEVFLRIPNEQQDFAYAENKWTLKQVIQHIIDCERVYAYRALRLSRFDSTQLPGFDSILYVDRLNTASLNLEALIKEYIATRQSTIALFSGMQPDMLKFGAIVNGGYCTARACGLIAAGHNLHHLSVLESLYLITPPQQQPNSQS